MRGSACQVSLQFFISLENLTKNNCWNVPSLQKTSQDVYTHTQTSGFIVFFPAGNISGNFSAKGKLILYLSNNEQYIKHKYIYSKN